MVLRLQRLSPLPEPERRCTLALFLEAINRDPELADFRRQVPAGPERQLALFAALERAAFLGSPAVCPPAVDDVADQLLCDLLELCDRDEELKCQGEVYGTERYKANLQALGAWSEAPRAMHLFATALSHLNADAAESLPALAVNCSPDPEKSRPNGDLIGIEMAEKPGDLATGGRIIRHGEQTPGEECNSLTALAVGCDKAAAAAGTPTRAIAQAGVPALADSLVTPYEIRQVRRGRPPVLDDLAKGRLLGLMSHGLSFRQAAAQLGVHHQTLLNALKRDEAFAQQVAEARLDAISQPLLVVVEAARKNWRAAAWLAKFLNDRRVSGYERTPEEDELERRVARS